MMTLINGEEHEKISVFDRGLAYGDGLFETILICGKHPQLMREHMARLRRGCERLLIDVNMDKLEREIELVCEKVSQHINWLKVIVTAGEGILGYGRGRVQGTRIIMAGYRKPWPEEWYEEGINLKICKTRCVDNPELSEIKHLNRLQHVLAKAEWGDEYQEGIMLDHNDNVIECTSSNILLLRDTTLITPRLDRCGVAGIMRECMLARAARAKLKIEETEVSVDSLWAVDKVFICSSMIGVCSVKSIDDNPVKRS